MRRAAFIAIVVALLDPPLGASAQTYESSDSWVDADDERPTRRGGRARSLEDARSGAGGLTLGQIGTREIPPTYVVARGDTLWEITGRFYGNPWEWPRVWSYNPEITNPHWIYPQDQVRLLPEGTPTTVTAPHRGRIVVRRGVERGTIFLREQGWLDEEALEQIGEIVGAPDDHMLLSPYDQVYVRFERWEGDAPRGEMTVFRDIPADQRGEGQEGVLARILGTVRIDEWDSEQRTARGTILEALEPIERGFVVAPTPRRFEVVPPARSERDLETRVVASLDEQRLVGTEQLVFIPVGEEDGVRLGNRFFVIRRGDDWRSDIAPSQTEAATVSLPQEPEEYPEETIAEARVVALRPHSAGLFVTAATRPVVVGDVVRMREGY